MTIFLFSGLLFGQEPDARALEQSWVKAITARDAGALTKILGDQLIYAHATGIVDTKSSYIEKVKSGKQKYDGVVHESMTFKLYPSTIVVHSRMHMWGVNQSGKFDDHLMLMHVWVKAGTAWQLVGHQTARLP